MKQEDLKDYRDYAWNYFALHAGQRMAVFRFYVIFATVIIGAFSTLVSKNGIQKEYFLLPLSLVFFSFIFWKLEKRTKMLVRNAEEALKHIDELCIKDDDLVLKLFHNDDTKTSNLHLWPLYGGYFSYSRVFKWVYIFLALLGMSGLVICLFR